MGMSLRKFYESIHRPRFLVGRRVAERTIENYDRSVRFWCELMTTSKFYINWPEVLRSVVDRMPQPRAFLSR